MQTFRRTCFYNDYCDRDSNRDNWHLNGRNDYNRDNYQSHSDDKPDLQKQLSDFIKDQHLTNSFVKETFIDLKNKLETTTKNQQASIKNIKAKFNSLADKQSGRPSGSLSSNTQPNPKGSSSKPYQPSQARKEHVNAIFTWSGKSYDPLDNPNDQQNDSETPINFDSDDEPTPQPKPKTPKPVKETPKPKPYKLKTPYPQLLRKEKMEAQYGKFFDMIQAVRINVPLVDVLAGMPNYGNIDEILEEDFDALLDEGSEILYSIEGTILEEKLFAEFDEFMAMTTDTEEPPFKKSSLTPFTRSKHLLKNLLRILNLNLFLITWNIPIHCVPKKSGITVVTNERNELVPTRTVTEGIVLGHKVSKAGLEVDKAKINVISKLLPPTNIKANHLSQIENEETSDDSEVNDNFPGETLMEINTEDEPWFADFANYLASDIIPKGMMYQQKIFFSQTSNTTSGRNPTSSKYVLMKTGNISKRDEMPLKNIQKLFCRFGMPKALISDKGTHFYNKIMEKTMKIYGVKNRFSTSYHPQTSGKVENINKALKRILEKTVKDNPAIWSRKLDDALWAFCTAYKTPTGTTPYILIYGKNCHLPFEIKHRAGH
ncbi:reverse transcriptase domain-containing protein [Tanacetum coccineum]